MEEKNFPSGAKNLIGLNSAADQLGVSRHSIKRHFPTVRVGGRILVRAADVEAKLMEGRVHAV